MSSNSPTDSPNRADKVAAAQRLRAEGLSIREIAGRMSAARSTVVTWLVDPDLAKQRARRAGYAGRCATCGRPTDGSGGRAAAPTECQGCRRVRERQEKRARVIREIRRFAELYGRPPVATDWNPAHAARTLAPAAARLAAERYAADGWPPTTVAQQAFGSWNAAIRAAGFEPIPSGDGRR